MASRNANIVDIPGLLPQPKIIEKLEGNSELSSDVRLETRNVSPLQRKAIRSILNSVGIRVVANKKRFEVEAVVEDSDKFDLSKVPEVCRKEYYELTVKGSIITIRTPAQEGTVWAAHTVAALLRKFLNGEKLPNMIIKDWPVLPVRGIFVENKWGPDRMDINDWMRTIDQLSALKMNTLGIGLYGCWGSCRYEGPDKPTEFLMVPVPERDDLKTIHTLKWYSPEKETWNQENYLPSMREKPELLSDVIAYASERGITVVPFVNSFGHNTFFAREIPEISAKDEKGNPTGVGYCITSPATREFVEKLYGSILDKYYPNGADYFHIQMDEVWPDYPMPDEPTKIGDPWCKCPVCKKKKAEENLLDYVFWLVNMLVKKGVKKVVMWNDQLTRHMSAFDAKFVKRLEKAGLKDKLILHWWWYRNNELNDQTRVSLGKKLGIDGWVAPMTCYYNWSTYDYRRPNIHLMLNMAEKEGAMGAVSYAVHDPSHLDHEALLAAYAWESCKGQKIEKVQKRWALSRFGEDADKYIAAADKILQAATTPNYGTCINYSYTYVRAGKPFPRFYPGEALETIEAADGALENLKQASKLATEADELLKEMLSKQGLPEQDTMCLKSLRGEAIRIQAVADAFAFLLDLRAKLKPGMVLKSMATNALKATDELIRHIAELEQCKPGWVIPATLQALSTLLLFFKQLTQELKKHAARKQAKQLNWTLLA
ncbi:MAG: family 20 glycosylhydrolase [Victivallales bacterium]|nr:family 20 glycosylhydrolase [Victivallales bacterium]